MQVIEATDDIVVRLSYDEARLLALGGEENRVIALEGELRLKLKGLLPPVVTPIPVGSFTPIDAANGIRLMMLPGQWQLLSGDVHKRVLGFRGRITFNSHLYEVFGRSCGLPNCNCDAEIRLIR